RSPSWKEGRSTHQGSAPVLQPFSKPCSDWPHNPVGAAAMGKAAGDEAYFQRCNLFWCTVITLSFGYYTMVAAKAEAGRAANAYFRTARPLPSLVTALALGYCAWVVFWPQSIPYQSLGPLGPFTQYLVDHHHTLLHNGFWLACLIHVGESSYALVLCKNKGITNGRARLFWFLQTFLFGIASLSILIAYRPKRQKQT
ncbi:Transmembrane protein 254, partial [Galemys pyrenaicus]